MFSMWLASFCASILSRILYQVLVRDIGLCSSGCFGCLASLGRRTIVALPKSSGTCLVSHMCFISLCVMAAAALPPACKSSAQRLSGPGALSFASFVMMVFINFLLVGFENALF